MAQHLSIRVPWKDNGYGESICDRPCLNTSCLRLKNVAENRDDAFEETICGKSVVGYEEQVPCLSEGGFFMSHRDVVREVNHPYAAHNTRTHAHFRPTKLTYPAFSFPARPFAWTMRERKMSNGSTRTILDLAEKYGIAYDEAKEPRLGFKTNWVQDADNQRAIFDVFFGDIKGSRSLVVPYAKQVPFVEDNKRVVLGVGHVTSIMPPPEYMRDIEAPQGSLRSILWETMVGHSIRDDRQDGFLFPYREMMAYAKDHPDFDMREVTVFADDDFREEFSYATEHLSCDAVISVLNQTIKVLGRIKECIPDKGNWDACIAWTRARREEVWQDRGIFPGLGALLCAVGFACGERMAKEIRSRVENPEEYEMVMRDALSNPNTFFSQDVAVRCGQMECRAFLNLQGERLKLFWLLSRMTLTEEQSKAIFCPENRGAGWQLSDSDILENPYRLYEVTRLSGDVLAIPLKKIDMALYPPVALRTACPVPPPSQLTGENDQRRVRAYVVNRLEELSEKGHTVYPELNLITEINGLPVVPGCHITSDIMSTISGFISDEIHFGECQNGRRTYQMKRYFEIDELIRRSVDKRLNGRRHDVRENWSERVANAFLGNVTTPAEVQSRATQEKSAALAELAASRLSVLIGGAGTGKTTLLSILCSSPQISNGGVLLLAPTGKARVRMSQAFDARHIQFDAKTIAQFLCRTHFDGRTMRYHLSDRDVQGVPATVIIDECSMLTEEMFGCLLQALKRARRIIFVGDPNQLPPIGAGRPFFDLVQKVRTAAIPVFPHVGTGFAELTVTMRQTAEDGDVRGDAELAKWFTDTSGDLDDNVFIQLEGNNLGTHLKFKRWETQDELQQKIIETIVEETSMKGWDDLVGFNQSLGGEVNGVWMNFPRSLPDVLKIESWQILSPFRNDPGLGTLSINRLIHDKYRSQNHLDLGNGVRIQKTRHPYGAESIGYGDKVINIRNQGKAGLRDGRNFDGYVANGEVGIVNFFWQGGGGQHVVTFSSQPGAQYAWYSNVSDESTPDLELAYALTVHKAQGSEFEKAILVLDGTKRVSKELLYTAITRQKNRLVILFNDRAYKLRDFSLASCSDLALRFTSLFENPSIKEYKNRYYEDRLIHVTVRGELVRSKSEVIIANMLHADHIPYEYEKRLDFGDGQSFIPDFTIEDAESGRTFYWEHCGMLADERYRQRWRAKKAVYEAHGIREGENLIVSQDEENGSIDCQRIGEFIRRIIG